MGTWGNEKTLVAVAALVATLGCSTSKPTPNIARPGALGSALSLEKGPALSGTVTKDEGDVVISLGRNSGTSVVASTKKGYAFEIDTTSGTVTKLQPLIPIRDQNSYVFTVSKKFVWEFATSAGTVGRNKSAFGGTQVTISKADIKDLVTDMSTLTPLAASEQQLYLVSKTQLLVFTWQGEKLGRQRIRLPRTFAADEPLLGAGPMNEAEPDKSMWLATSKKLMVFNGATWREKNFTINANPGEIEFVSLYFKSEADKLPSDPLIGLLESGGLATLVLPAAGKAVASQPESGSPATQGEVAR